MIPTPAALRKLKFLRTKTEAALWLLFFLIVAGFGFLQGWKPEINLSQLFGRPEKIEILSSSPVFFPEKILRELEKETGTEIRILPFQNWEEARLKIIADPGADLLFLPAHWVQALRQENLLRSSTRFQNLATEILSSDFHLNPSSQAQDFLPLYWSRLSFVAKNQNPKNLGILDDADVFMDIIESLKLKKQDSAFLKMKFQFFDLDQWSKPQEPSLDAAFVSHLWAEKHPQWQALAQWPELLGIWGFALPKNSRLSGKMEKVIHAYASAVVQAEILEQLPLASTLSVMDERAGPLGQKALYLRDLGLLRMNLIRQHDPAHLIQARGLSALTFSN